MKTKLFVFILFFSGLFLACEDSTVDSIGMGMLPDEDQVNVYDTVISIDSAYTVQMESIYARTMSGLLGNFYDPDYGDIKAGYICQYYPSLGFADSVVDNKIDSVRLNILYTSYFGDSLAPMEITVFPVEKKLPENYYTNIDPADYCNMNQILGKKTYTACDLSVSDSARWAYYPVLSVPLSTEWGQKVYDDYVKNKRKFWSLDEFTDYFKGTYLASSFGVGSLINVVRSEINIYYNGRYKITDESSGAERDTTVASTAAFTVTREVMQLNNFKDTHSSQLLKPDSAKMYLKTPVGVFSKIIIPVSKIVKGIGTKKFSAVRLSIDAYPQPESGYALPLPGVVPTTTRVSPESRLLLIEADSVKSFFENQKTADSNTSYTTVYDASNRRYHFSNIANLIQNAIAKAPEKDLELLIIPVQVEWQYYNSYYMVDYSTSYYLMPSAVTLKKGKNNLQLQIIASDLVKNSR